MVSLCCRLACLVALVTLALGLAPHAARGQGPYDRYIYPLAKPRPSPTVTMDVTAAPEAGPWAEQARSLVRQWFPIVCQLLATEQFTPPKTIRLVFKPNIDAPAYTAGDEITINAGWIHDRPDDFGMVVHELTHVVQAYPSAGDKPGWLVEGIADYVRWWRYEPEAPRPHIDLEKSSYRDGYRTTGAFLAWLLQTYDKRLLHRLDQALRTGTYSDAIFQQVTGKPLDTLWKEFVQSTQKR